MDRHGRARPGRPGTGNYTASAAVPPAGVGGRDTPGHDGEREFGSIRGLSDAYGDTPGRGDFPEPRRPG
jgi:hypothetical protein